MASLWPRPNLATTPVAGDIHAQMVRATGFEREGDKVYLAPEVLQGRYSKAADMFRCVVGLCSWIRGGLALNSCAYSFGMTMLETASNIVVPDQYVIYDRRSSGANANCIC